MNPDSNFQSVLKTQLSTPAVKFDADNPKHRAAYAEWELTGRWPIRFLTEWPMVTVPQTVLTALARRACVKEFDQVSKARNIELKPGVESYAFCK